MTSCVRIAIISEDDRVWALPAWERTVRLLCQDGHTIVGIWTCPPALAQYRGAAVSRWYLSAFGYFDFLKLGVFALLAHMHRIVGGMLRRRAASFQALAAAINTHYAHCESPNDGNFIAWLASNRIDILLITVGFVLKKEVLSVPRLGTVNKHAALLPANRGLFPYFWAKLYGTPQGISYHLVTAGIDEGPLLVQDDAIPPHHLTTMIRFYVFVFETFPMRMRECVRLLADGGKRPMPPLIPGSYHGLPTYQDIEAFRGRGGRIVSVSDMLTAFQAGHAR